MPGSGWSAYRQQQLSGGQQLSGFGKEYQVTRALALFPSADQAGGLLSTAQQRWQPCANHTYNYTYPNGTTTVWDSGSVSITNGTLHNTSTQENGNGNACDRALTVSNNVAIDVLSCGPNPAGSAVNIAHQMAAKVAKQ
jgi:hypothetical protein